jgi:hypothetical protein
MLERIDHPAIVEEVQDIQIARDATLHTVTLRHEEGAERIGLYGHGSDITAVFAFDLAPPPTVEP